MNRHPILFQINGFTWLRRLSAEAGRELGIGDVTDAELDRFRAWGVDFLWVLGAWARSPAARRLAHEHAGAYTKALADFHPRDVSGSPFAVRDYRVAPELGGEAALARLRQQLAARGIGLVLDFVPNHTARDHPWIRRHPERYVSAPPERAAERPEAYFFAETDRGPRAVAFGRDPYFPGWTDTAQLDWLSPDVHRVMAAELASVAARCDGVRCDMAMLPLEDVFRRTWPEASERRPDSIPPFWPGAIDGARAIDPRFVPIAEVYWGLGPRLLEAGFDFVYDKELYDRLRDSDAAAVRRAIRAPLSLLGRGAHFVENHDEEPAVTAFPRGADRPAAAIALTLPGLRIVHEGQIDGRTVRLPVQLNRAAAPVANASMRAFVDALFGVLGDEALRNGSYGPLDVLASGEGAPPPDAIVAHAWSAERRVVVIAANLSDAPAAGRVTTGSLPFAARPVRVRDLLDGGDTGLSADDVREGLHLTLAPRGVSALGLEPGTSP